MSYWQSTPFLKILLPFIMGLSLYTYLPQPGPAGMPLFYFPVFLCWCLLGPESKFRLRILPGIFLSLAFIHAGLLIGQKTDARTDPRWSGHFPENPAFIARLIDTRSTRRGKYICTAGILYRHDGNRWHTARGNVQVFVSGSASPPPEGAIVWLGAPLEYIAPDPPGTAFPVQAYLASRHIYQKLQVRSGSFEIIAMPDDKRAGRIGILRLEILSAIDRYIPGPDENGLSKALLLGYRGGLDKDIIQAYSGTGVIHVIAVSGLHLGLIYAVLTFLFKPLAPYRGMRYIKSFATLGLLWLFTLLCGASPSVLRSALMFSSLLVGQFFQKDNYAWNALASSAFILLCLDPGMLMDIGFQLSYGAVASIMLYHKKISSFYGPGNRILTMAWAAIATSLSAQVLTTPLILYHFHQFPLFFILSNLVAVPLSGIILLLLIGLCLVSPFPGLAVPAAAVVSFLCRFLNLQILRLNSISFGLVKGIYPDGADLFTMFGCIAMITAWIGTRKTIFAWFLLFMLFFRAIIQRCCG